MITIEDIKDRAEGQTFDCKSVKIEPKALAVPIVAMANADGGMLAIGISDKTRKIEGVDQYPSHVNELLKVPFSLCVPSVNVKPEFIPCVDVGGKPNHVLLLHIPASATLHANQADEVFMRVGDSSRKLSFEERISLMYDKGERYFEDSAAYDATIEDVDLNCVQDYLNVIGYNKSPMEYLHENNNFIIHKDGKEQISTACILLFGKKPQQFFPRARVRFIRYMGTEEKVGREMNVIKDVTFEGRILDQIRKTIDYLESQVKEHTYLGEKGIFVTDREYSPFVLQEMTVNSICHRDYSIKGTEIQIKLFDDRLVFETPGKFPGIVRSDNIRHTHFSRNPKIAEYLKVYKYVREFGEGVDRMCKELEAKGLKDPKYVLNAFIMKGTVYAYNAKGLSLEGNIYSDNKNVTVNSNVTIKTAKDASFGENCTVNSKTFTVNGQNCTVNCTVNGRIFTINFTINRKIFTISLTAMTKNILWDILEEPTISTEILAQKYSCTTRTVKNHLAILKKLNVLKREGGNKNGLWVLDTDSMWKKE